MSKAPLRRGLLETQLFLDIRSGEADAVQFALDMLTFTALDVSEYSVMVLLSICQDPAETVSNLRFLQHNHVHRVTAAISRAAFRLFTLLPAPCGLTADDAIVAATAMERSLPLYTLDPARFAAVPGLAAVRPY